MAQDISGVGISLQVKGDVTFPAGFTVTEFADDADPFDIPSIQIADKAMGLNGDLLTWSKAVAIDFTISVIPNSEADANLSALANANRVGKNKTSARDKITVTGVYPDGKTFTLAEGRITDAPVAIGIASAGRMKTNAYKFAFESITKS
jgi:hypothetical protein